MLPIRNTWGTQFSDSLYFIMGRNKFDFDFLNDKKRCVVSDCRHFMKLLHLLHYPHMDIVGTTKHRECHDYTRLSHIITQSILISSLISRLEAKLTSYITSNNLNRAHSDRRSETSSRAYTANRLVR